MNKSFLSDAYMDTQAKSLYRTALKEIVSLKIPPWWNVKAKVRNAWKSRNIARFVLQTVDET